MLCIDEDECAGREMHVCSGLPTTTRLDNK